MAIIKIKTKIELSEKELTGFRAAIEKMGLAPEEAVKLFFNEASCGKIQCDAAEKNES